MSAREKLLLVAGCFCILSVCLSTWLIRQHQINMTNFSVQSKIVGIIWMIPIYAIDSFMSLIFPTAALYIDMLRDCYEAYVLYLFLSLMLSFLNSAETQEEGGGDQICEDNLIEYLETKEPPPRLPIPFSLLYPGDLPKGRGFLRFCKFGTLQYCIFRPLTTLIAILLDRLGLYHEASIGPNSGWMFLAILVNISIAFAFAALATFYTTLKKKLAPYEPVGKFLCIKFVIFFAFWQSVIIAILVRVGSIHAVEGYTTHNLARGLQDTLICGEMFLVSIAHLYTFSYRPFTEEGRREKLLLRVTSTDHSLTGPLLSSPTDQCGGDPEDPGARLPEKKKILQEKETASNRGSSSIVSANENGHGHGQRIKCTQSGGHQVDVNTETARGSFDIKGRFVTPVLIPRKGGFRPPISGQTSTPTSVKNNGMIAAGTSNRTLKNLDEQTCNQSNSVFRMLDRNFASSAAVRDFNESMPVIVLPSNFTPEKGRVALSRPSDRVSD